MLTSAHSVHSDHNRNRKTLPYPHIFIFKSSHHIFWLPKFRALEKRIDSSLSTLHGFSLCI